MSTNTKMITVPGFVVDVTTHRQTELDVRFTSDDIGETLSITLGEQIQLIVPFEKVEDLIKRTRKSQKKH